MYERRNIEQIFMIQAEEKKATPFLIALLERIFALFFIFYKA